MKKDYGPGYDCPDCGLPSIEWEPNGINACSRCGWGGHPDEVPAPANAVVASPPKQKICDHSEFCLGNFLWCNKCGAVCSVHDKLVGTGEGMAVKIVTEHGKWVLPENA